MTPALSSSDPAPAPSVSSDEVLALTIAKFTGDVQGGKVFGWSTPRGYAALARHLEALGWRNDALRTLAPTNDPSGPYLDTLREMRSDSGRFSAHEVAALDIAIAGALTTRTERTRHD